jgi:hypothetical protein
LKRGTWRTSYLAWWTLARDGVVSGVEGARGRYKMSYIHGNARPPLGVQPGVGMRFGALQPDPVDTNRALRRIRTTWLRSSVTREGMARESRGLAVTPSSSKVRTACDEVEWIDQGKC